MQILCSYLLCTIVSILSMIYHTVCFFETETRMSHQPLNSVTLHTLFIIDFHITNISHCQTQYD